MIATMQVLSSTVSLLQAAPTGLLASTSEAEAAIDGVGHITSLVRWSGVLTSVFVVIGASVALRFVRTLVARSSARFATRRLLFQKMATIFQFVVYICTGLSVVMLSVRLDDKLVTMIGGTVAVAIGFAVKDLVASFVAGVMIMMDRPFQVGDRVAFGGEYGDITAIGLRSVRLVSLDDNVITIPNNKFLSDITSCGNYGALDMQVGIDFYIGIDQNIDLAREIVNEATVSSRYVYLEKPVTVLASQVIVQQYIAIKLRVKAYVLDTRFEKALETDVNLRVLAAFRAQGIAPPAILHRSSDGTSPRKADCSAIEPGANCELSS